MALRKRNFNRAGTETRPYPPEITDNRQIFAELVEATRQLSVVAPKLVKIRIAVHIEDILKATHKTDREIALIEEDIANLEYRDFLLSS